MSDRDLIERLRARKVCKDGIRRQPQKHEREAADLLESQAAEIERLREALGPFARAEHIVASCDDRIRCTLTYPKDATETFTLGSLEAARQAIKGTGADHG